MMEGRGKKHTLKIEFLSNHLSDLTRIWNLGSGNQTKIKKGVYNEDDPPWKMT